MRSIKCVIVGDGLVGKTSLVIRYAAGEFRGDQYTPTVFDSYSGTIEMFHNRITLNIFDTAGQNEYEQLRKMTYPGADVVLICFSVDDRNTYNNVRDMWNNEATYYAPNALKILIGTKMDVRSNGMCRNGITYREGCKLCKEIKALKYLECSAKTGVGVKSVFDESIMSVINSSEKVRNSKKCSLI